MTSTCAYLDLEANAITNEVISIGIVTQSGDTYYSLVRPHTKLDRKIKELTGITQEEAAGAPSVETVMREVKSFLAAHPAIQLFYCYGTGDKAFLQASKNFTHDEECLLTLDSISTRCFDASEYIALQFHRHTIGLRSAYLTLRLSEHEPAIQNHNALEDAEMLKWVWEHIDDYEIPYDVEPVRVDKPNMYYGNKSKVSTGRRPDPDARFTGRNPESRRNQLRAAIPEAADRKYSIPIRATKMCNGKVNHYVAVTSALPLVAKNVHTPQQMFDAMELIYTMLDTGIPIKGWLFEKD